MILRLIFLIFIYLYFVSVSQAQIEDIVIESEVFKSKRNISVFLPAAYNEDEDKYDSFVPLYVLDGQDKILFNLICYTVDYLSSSITIPPLIVIGIISTDRTYEFTPIPKNESTQSRWRNTNLGGQEKLRNHLTDEVFPYINANFRVLPYKIGFGHSLGGSFIVNSMSFDDKLFNAHIALSPNLEFDNNQIIKNIENQFQNQKIKYRFLFASAGGQHPMENRFKKSLMSLEVLLEKYKRNQNFHFRYYDDLTHSSIAAKGFVEALSLFSSNWVIKQDQIGQAYSKKISITSFLDDFYSKSSKSLGFEVKPSSWIINEYAWYFRERGLHKEALQVYFWGVKILGSKVRPYLYDQIGIIYEQNSDMINAKKYYKEAFEQVVSNKELYYNQDVYQRTKDFYDQKVLKFE